MTIPRAFRWLLALASIAIVAWSFFDVGMRAINRARLARNRPITLTVLHWGGKEEGQIVQTLVDRYMEENPHVRIIRINPGTGDFRAKIKTMMAAGTPPDVFYLPPDIFAEFAHLKLVRPIDDYFAREPKE